MHLASTTLLALVFTATCITASHPQQSHPVRFPVKPPPQRVMKPTGPLPQLPQANSETEKAPTAPPRPQYTVLNGPVQHEDRRAPTATERGAPTFFRPVPPVPKTDENKPAVSPRPGQHGNRVVNPQQHWNVPVTPVDLTAFGITTSPMLEARKEELTHANFEEQVRQQKELLLLEQQRLVEQALAEGDAKVDSNPPVANPFGVSLKRVQDPAPVDVTRSRAQTNVARVPNGPAAVISPISHQKTTMNVVPYVNGPTSTTYRTLPRGIQAPKTHAAFQPPPRISNTPTPSPAVAVSTKTGVPQKAPPIVPERSRLKPLTEVTPQETHTEVTLVSQTTSSRQQQEPLLPSAHWKPVQRNPAITSPRVQAQDVLPQEPPYAFRFGNHPSKSVLRRSIYSLSTAQGGGFEQPIITYIPMNELQEAAKESPAGFSPVTSDLGDINVELDESTVNGRSGLERGDVVEILAEEDAEGSMVPFLSGQDSSDESRVPNGPAAVVSSSIAPRQPQFDANPSSAPLNKKLPNIEMKKPKQKQFERAKRYKLLKKGSHNMVFLGKVKRVDDQGEVIKGRFGRALTDKVVLKIAPRNSRAGQNLQKEGVILSHLNHPNILKLSDEIPDEANVVLVFPYYSQGTLSEYVSSYIGSYLVMGTSMVRILFRPIVDAVHYLHQQGIAHRDIKSQNIVINGPSKHPEPILIDFNAAFSPDINPSDRASTRTTRHLSPPEMNQKDVRPSLNFPIDPYKADVWMLGVTIVSTLTGYEPKNCFSMLEFVTTKLPKVKTWSPGLKDLLKGMLRMNPLDRWDMNRVKSHPWWQGDEFSVSPDDI